MASDDDAKESLLPDMKDHSHLNEKNNLQRRRENGVEYPLPFESIFVKQQFSIKHVVVLLAAYLGGGTLCFFLIRHQIKGKKTSGILDAIYFCVVTMTTVGYGDLVPETILAKLLACIYVFTGMALVGLILSQAADYVVEKQEILVVRAIYMRGKVSPDEILKEVKTNKIKYKFILVGFLLLVLIVVGTVFLFVVEELSFMDAFYCVCSTITTLGYGDESFSTAGGRIFAIFWMLGSTICLAQFFLYLAELYTERRHRSMVKWVLSRELTFSDLEAADLDRDKVVSAAEFVIYKLKEMGKISSEDVSLVMETFKRLDADQSGSLTKSDLRLSQSSQAQI
ncbi:two-pore potassium channel 1-like [Corylus avellana]|uniref:two-pore potassium channel 1-like n=1 Tax=Corylus avellana TaxID=13451 RepID=UPI001E231F0C|nr:two-pore potassium channel 1-like [Corylus avellana]